jgi:DNA-binding NarL/FixJ family response regulator
MNPLPDTTPSPGPGQRPAPARVPPIAPAATPLRVLICDDNDMLREALGEIVAAQPDLELVGGAIHADEAVRLVARWRPDVVVLDVRFPGGGPDSARRMLRVAPDTRILAFSAYSDSGAMTSMEAAGVREYLVKGVTNAEFVAAVRRVGQAGPPGSTGVRSGGRPTPAAGPSGTGGRPPPR